MYFGSNVVVIKENIYLAMYFTSVSFICDTALPNLPREPLGCSGCSWLLQFAIDLGIIRCFCQNNVI